MSLGHLIKTLNTTPVASKVSVHVSTMSLSANASDRKFMVWLQRKGKSRGTALVRATGASVNWAETVTQTCTLYRCPDGTCKRKRFDVVVIWNSCQEEAPGQVFGKVEIDVSESCGKQSYKLDECGEDASITLDIRSEPEDGIDTPTKKSMCAEPRSSSKKSKNPVGGFGSGKGDSGVQSRTATPPQKSHGDRRGDDRRGDTSVTRNNFTPSKYDPDASYNDESKDGDSHSSYSGYRTPTSSRRDYDDRDDGDRRGYDDLNGYENDSRGNNYSNSKSGYQDDNFGDRSYGGSASKRAPSDNYFHDNNFVGSSNPQENNYNSGSRMRGDAPGGGDLRSPTKRMQQQPVASAWS